MYSVYTPVSVPATSSVPTRKRKRDVLRDTFALMAPKRKKSRQNTQAPVEQQQQSRDANQSSSDTQKRDPESETPSAAQVKSDDGNGAVTDDSPKPAPNRGSWYGGSWRLKSSPVIETAKESISVAQGVTSEALAESGRQIAEASKRPGQYVSKGMRASRKSIPLVAEPTKVNATSDVSDKSRPRGDSGEKLKGLDGKAESEGKPAQETKSVLEDAPLPPEPAAETAGTEDTKSIESNARPQSGAWFGWWSRPDGYDGDRTKAKDGSLKLDEASSTPLPGTPNAGPTADAPAQNSDVPAITGQDGAAEPGLQPDLSAKTGSSRSWFGLWSSAQNEQAAEEGQADRDAVPPQPLEVTVTADPAEAPKDASTAAATSKDDKVDLDDRPKSSGWAFWSSDRSKESAPTPGGTQKQVGELAVADTPSQSHPEAAQFNEQRDSQASKSKPKRTGSLLKSKRGRTEELAVPVDSTATTPSASPAPSTPGNETALSGDSDAPKPVQRGKAAQLRPNLILPSFTATYPLAPNPSYIQQVTQYITDTLRLTGGQSTPQHVYRSHTKPKIRKAISLGVHGFFPAALIQKVLGQPTGTSIRFANYGAAAIKAWCQENQPEIKDIEIDKVALEGEGFVADRITTLWKLMLNWLPKLRSADFILVACHSQGVPVAISLIAKLIQLGCLSPSARIGVSAMAGINLGPFLEYKSRLWGGSALELFDFCDSSSTVSKSYAESLDVCLRHGVRITYVGSLDDQLISLESSLHMPLSHPYVNRAVFIDGRLHAPNFLTHLVIFALKLRNLGVSDHGLIRELSAPLAGSLVGGEGHSRVYDDPAVYRLGIDFALESTDAPPPPPSHPLAATTSAKEAALARRSSLSGYPSTTTAANNMRRGSADSLPGIGALMARYEPPPTAGNANPFYLPWAVRGLLEEEVVKREMMDEVRELVREFDEWKPTSKVLRDVRWRLEAVRGMV